MKSSLLGRLQCLGLAVVYCSMALFSGIPSSVWAQSADIEAPSIQLQRVSEGRAGEAQVISATVTDNLSLSSITLFYRLDGRGGYDQMSMRPLGNTSIYTASILTQGTEASELQYYIEAVDAAGNRTQEGFSFDPRVRVLTDGSSTPQADSGSETAPAAKNRKGLLYGVLGVLALGVIVAAAGGSDSGSGTPSDENTDIPVTIVADPL